MLEPLPDTSDPKNAPETETEKQISAIWCDLLGVKHVQQTDSFYGAGGESILAMQCLNRMRTVFGVQLSPIDLFSDDATLSQLALFIDARR